MRILFLVPYPQNAAPSQRFRFEQYFKILEENGHRFEVSAFLDSSAWTILYRPGHLLQKVAGLLCGFGRRIRDLFRLKNFDVVFIHREAAPFGPPFFEWFITRVAKKYCIFDFDDAIWIPNASESNSNLTKNFKFFSNVPKICRWATKVSAGNSFLRDYALTYNPIAIVNPTTIDTHLYHNTTTDHTNSKFIFGWTGSHSTIQYLDALFPVFKEL